MRLIEVTLPAGERGPLRETLEGVDSLDVWTVQEGSERVVMRVLVPKEGAEAVTDLLRDRFEGRDGFRIVLLEVTATVPSPDDSRGEEEEAEAHLPARVSREELHEDLSSAARPGLVYFVTVGLSTVVASVGLVRGDVAVIVGAMVIAPLLGPNMAISLASALGDVSLAWRAFRSAAGGALLSFAIAFLLGVVLVVDPSQTEIARRTVVGPADVALALAAGTAGALAYTGGLPAGVIGVMVAVALLPPLVAMGLLAGDGHAGAAAGSLVLVVTNVVCLNLAGVTTFLLQRVRPRNWWEEERARKATVWAVSSWLVMLAVLAWVILTRFE